MKTKLSVAALIMSGGVMMMFAATKADPKADPCAEKYKSCTDSCSIVQGQSLARGVDRLRAENAYNRCVKACEKAKTDCDGKAKKP
ncbi:MAG TPA: hypothetical protein VLH83_00760 [Chthoniobacterales bacterium]|nr:hypothetical protein [Chthoniobacterales bacterium]